jgi:hypothetical protein
MTAERPLYFRLFRTISGYFRINFLKGGSKCGIQNVKERAIRELLRTCNNWGFAGGSACMGVGRV